MLKTDVAVLKTDVAGVRLFFSMLGAVFTSGSLAFTAATF